MSEEDQDKVFRGQGNVCAPAVPLPMEVLLYTQQQTLEMMQIMMRAHPLYKFFAK